jgi:hypothetical protein
MKRALTIIRLRDGQLRGYLDGHPYALWTHSNSVQDLVARARDVAARNPMTDRKNGYDLVGRFDVEVGGDQ